MTDIEKMEHFATAEHVFVVALLGIYLWGEYGMTYDAAEWVYGRYGIACSLMIIALSFITSGPIVGCLSIIVMYLVTYRASQIIGPNYVSEEQKWSPYAKTTDIPETLEQKVIEARVPNKFIPIINPRNEVQPTCGNMGSATQYEK